MPPSTLTPSAPLQGVTMPNLVINPDVFYAATRRLRFQMAPLKAIAGMGSSDPVQLRQTGIVAGLEVRVTGTITFGGTITGTSMLYEWPLNLIQNLRLSANGQSNLMDCRGLTLRAFEFVSNPKLDDTGLTATFGATAVTSGSLKLPCDDWGTSGVNTLNPGATVAAIGTYTVDLTFIVPVAADAVSLIGAIFAQSQATNLTVSPTWATQAQICTLGGSATFAQALQWQVTGRAYSIPNVGGQFVVPDLSQFHQITENRTSGIGQGGTSILLPGSGAGRRLLRVLWNAYSGATPVPLALTAANYNQVNWAYGGSDIPEAYPNGTQLRADIIRVAGADLGGNWGLGLWDFASQFALRDSVDEGATSDLRYEFQLVNAPTSGYVQTAQETLFAAPVGA
jgi:hypothetical protein